MTGLGLAGVLAGGDCWVVADEDEDEETEDDEDEEEAEEDWEDEDTSGKGFLGILRFFSRE